MKSIAGYNVIKLLAKGGMAAIYLAEQTSLKRQVVLKFLNPRLDENVRRRFIDEGLIIASLKHPNIITIFDVVSSGKYDFLSMEYLPDGDLESQLTSKPDLFYSLSIISKISDALHLIHKQGIIHGDIKPANILFRGKDCPLLTDFGISHQIAPKKEVDLNPDNLYASPSYASPELIQGKPFDYRTDMYSLGVMMYEMLMGTKPFTGETDLETIANSIQQPIPELSEELHELQPLLNSLLAKSPNERLSDAKLVTRFITQYLKEHSNITNLSSETKLIDTDVVVEYMAKKKGRKQVHGLKYFIVSFVLLTSVLTSLFIFFYKDTNLDNTVVVSKAAKETQLSIVTKDNVTNSKIEAKESAEQLKRTEAAFIKQQEELQKKILLEQQTALEQKNREVVRAKKELEGQKKRALQEKLSQKKASIKRFLKKGTASLKKFQLTTPLNDNALYYFQKVLELDENNKDAKKGIEAVVYHYELLARSEIDKYSYQKAQYYISKGLSVDADNERLLELQNQANLHSEPGRIVNKVKNFFKNL